MVDDTFIFKGAWVRRIEFSLTCPKCGRSFEDTGYVACSDLCEGPGNLYGVDCNRWLEYLRHEKDYYDAVDREQFERHYRDEENE